MINKKIITITGAAGNISYSLIFRLLSGNIFSDNSKIQLNLLDIKEALPILLGVKYEIEDCAFNNLDSILITDNPEKAFADADFVLLLGAKPRLKGMQRADLLLDNANIFQDQAKIIDNFTKSSAKIIIVGNPANTNALIILHHTKKIPSENITSLMRLDQNRAKSILGSKVNKPVESIKQLIVWGNHSTTQFPDISNTLISNENSFIKSLDASWIDDIFIPRVQNRGAEIIEHRGKSSAASAASAIYDHLHALVNGSNDWESMGVISNNSYGIDSEIFFSFPLNITDSSLSIINNLVISEAASNYIKKSEAELISERDIIKDILKS